MKRKRGDGKELKLGKKELSQKSLEGGTESNIKIKHRLAKGASYSRYPSPAAYYKEKKEKFTDGSDVEATFFVSREGKLSLVDDRPAHARVAIKEYEKGVLATGKVIFDHHGRISSISNESICFQTMAAQNKWLVLVLYTLRDTQGFETANRVSIKDQNGQVIVEDDITGAFNHYYGDNEVTNSVTDQIKRQNLDGKKENVYDGPIRKVKHRGGLFFDDDSQESRKGNINLDMKKKPF